MTKQNGQEETNYEKIDEEVVPQEQETQPGVESEMKPEPIYDDPEYKGSGKLKGKKALVTGGDSGIGRAVAVAFAKEGADVAIAYLADEEDGDAEQTVRDIEKYGGKAMKVKTDLRDEENCRNLLKQVADELGGLNILVNNAGVQFPKKDIEAITSAQLKNTFESNFFSMFYLTRESMAYLKDGDCIINTSSVTAYNGSPGLLDYSATKGAITAFTRSFAQNIASKGIRVNAVAPGPIWTPLIPATFDAKKVEQHGSDTTLKRRGQPAELAPSYVLLASKDGSYMTGQTIHVDGGDFLTS
ncbi:SDR family oxidoreductase [Bhargavaea ullalensis]|uniref:NAD(P)-dependent dehydrogenase (Short-subunit alcohol dehydrogenase family) n=1 Tax=Bhargavaea ullalensis TaxID=1265685 RepID=A0ABV2GA10_9BACL